jgi:hypothetical protein
MEVIEIVSKLKNPESKMVARAMIKLLCRKEVSKSFLEDLNQVQADGECKVILEHMKNLAQAVADNFEQEDGHATIA